MLCTLSITSQTCGTDPFTFSGLVSVIGALTLNLGNVRAGRLLHAKFLRNIIASPMSFFDQTPLGRILNRFGKDLDVLDNVMSPLIHIWLWCLLNTFSTPIVISYSTPLFLSVIAPLFIAYLVIQVSNFYTLKARIGSAF